MVGGGGSVLLVGACGEKRESVSCDGGGGCLERRARVARWWLVVGGWWVKGGPFVQFEVGAPSIRWGGGRGEGRGAQGTHAPTQREVQYMHP